MNKLHSLKLLISDVPFKDLPWTIFREFKCLAAHKRHSCSVRHYGEEGSSDRQRHQAESRVCSRIHEVSGFLISSDGPALTNMLG